MKVMCSHCEQEGGSALIGEKEPLNDPRITHGICPKHCRQLLEEIRALSTQGSPSGAVAFPGCR